MLDTKITKMVQLTRYDAEMKPYDVYVITFTVGSSGPFTCETPVEGFDSLTAKLFVEEKARGIASMLGG